MLRRHRSLLLRLLLAVPTVPPSLGVAPGMDGEEAGEAEEFGDGRRHRAAFPDPILNPFEVEGHDLLVVGVGQGVIGAELLDRLLVLVPPRHDDDDVVEGSVGAAVAGEADRFGGLLDARSSSARRHQHRSHSSDLNCTVKKY